jgi:hypothetical protein
MNWRDNVTIYGHGGDTLMFHSNMVLFPEYNIGLFVSTNTASGTGISGALPMAFLDHYFPTEQRVLPTPGPDAHDHAKIVAGTYVNMRNAYTTIGKFLEKPTEWRMEATADGYLLVHIGTTTTVKAVEVSPYRYALVDSISPQMGDILFILDANGVPAHFVFTGIAPAGTYERLGTAQQQGFASGVLLVAEVLMLSSFLWIGVAAYRWRKGGQKLVAPQAVIMVASAAALAFVYLIDNGVDVNAQSMTWSLSLLSPEPLSAYMLIPAAVVVLVIGGALLSMVTVWQGKRWSRWEKVHAVAVMAGLVGFLYWAHFWRLV